MLETQKAQVVNSSRRDGFSAGCHPLFRVALSILSLWALLMAPAPSQIFAAEKETPIWHYQVVNTYPHDPKAFCQGLAYSDGFLYEGTGLYGESSVRKVELETGKVLRMLRLNREIFGEGITLLGDKLYQLTWKNRRALVFRKEPLRYEKSLPYEGEGWGLTTDGEHLILSDGSSRLKFVDPENFQVVRSVIVRNQGRPVDQLNELEYVEGEIFANLWYSDYLVRISPTTGNVVGWVDLRGILDPSRRGNRDNVLNGIAYDTKGKRLFVTGKRWPKLFEIRLVRRR